MTKQDNDRTALPPHAPLLDDDEELEGIVTSDPVLIFEVSLNGADLDLIEPAAIAAGLSVSAANPLRQPIEAHAVSRRNSAAHPPQ